MIKNEYTKQTEIEVVSIEQLVPQDHLLRMIEDNYDFSFVRKRMEPLYSRTNGRPAIDPVMLFKMLFIGYLYGIRSERQLEKEVQVNMAYRWFLNLSLTDKVPHHSTISQNRRRRFNGTDVFRQMFDDVVQYAYEHEYIDGKTLFTDSTHLKANANKKKFNRELVQKNTQTYLDELEQAVNEDRIAHGKKPLPPKEEPDEEEMKEIKVSTTDPESGYWQGLTNLRYFTTWIIALATVSIT
jgi:transposase